MHLDRLKPEDVLNLELPTGAPLLYEIDAGGNVVAKRYL
jgi:2,3-bisphosphoglycerate-dependent phosphoglycerate mutase